MKKSIAFLSCLAVLAGIALVAYSQSDLTTNTAYPWTAAYQSESAGIPEASKHKVGWASVTYSVARHTGAVGAKSIGVVIPDNAVVMQGVIDVMTAILPVASTNAIHLQTANDILTAGTNVLDSTGIKACTPVDTAASAIKMTADRTLTLTTTGNAITQGVFKIWIKYYQSN